VELDEPESSRPPSSAGSRAEAATASPPSRKQPLCSGDFSAEEEFVDGVSERLRLTTGSSLT
jgi:hypothetical protein